MFQFLKKFIVSNNFANHCPERIQNEATECGAVSLQMVLEYYGVVLSTEQLRDECQVSRDGSKASSLLKTARKYGFEAQGYRVSRLEDITQYKMPAILFWEFNHFLVCLGKKGNAWVLNDPGCGRRIVHEDVMTRSFTGILLEIKPGKDVKKQGKRPSFIRNMSFLLRDCKHELLMLIIIGLLLLPLSVIQPNMNSLVIDYFFKGYYNWGLPILCFSLLMLLLTIGLSFIQNDLLFLLNIRMTISNSYRLLTKLFSMPLMFFQSRFSGDLTSRVQCCESVGKFFAEQFVSNMLNFMSLLLFAVILICFDPVLGSAVVMFAVSIIVVLLRFANAKKTTSTKKSIELSKMLGRTVHGIGMIETLKASGMENEFYICWADMYKRYLKIRLKMQSDEQFLQFMQGLISKLSVAMLAGLGAYRILMGRMTGGTYISFQLIFACFMAPIYNLISMLESFQTVRADANRLLDIIHYPTPETTVSADEALPVAEVAKLGGSVKLCDLTFGYNRNLPPVVDHINLEIAPGERIAIVGLSGSGKSTLAKLISGAYTPWSGDVLFDGHPRQSYTLQQLRYSFAMVNQDISLFPGNVRDNIAMYDTALPFANIRNAAEDALIHDTIIARRGGYAYEINPTGSNFSGGEQQRIEIARALAVNPSILLLDEATAALDPATELKIDRNLRRRGLTTIVIAHRLSTVRDADRIVVLDHGKIAECGTHAQLLKINGLYAKLVNL